MAQPDDDVADERGVAVAITVVALNAQINRQAAMVSYIDVIGLLFLLTFAVKLLLLLMRDLAPVRTQARPSTRNDRLNFSLILLT